VFEAQRFSRMGFVEFAVPKEAGLGDRTGTTHRDGQSMIRNPFTRALQPLLALACLAAPWPWSAEAASIEPRELAALHAEAREAGAVPVMVHLQASTLAQLHGEAVQLRAASDAKARRLYAELGHAALANGRWSNGAGQIGMYVTEAGLDVLSGTANAIFFAPGAGWQQRTMLDGLDGSHEAIEKALRDTGFVDLEVVANADGLMASHGADGRVRFASASAAGRTAGAKLAQLLQDGGDRAFPDRAGLVARANAMATYPVLTMRATREGLLRLATSDAVRSIKPLGYLDSRPTEIDPSALERAARDGEADVIVVMRDGYAGGKLSDASRAASNRSNRTALESVLAHARPGVIRQDFSEFGAVSARLNASELAMLASSGDKRVLAVTLDRPVASPQMTYSVPLMNMQSAWNAGLYGAGQNIIVMDSGVEANHPFFGGRVVYQACFGTTTTGWLSTCPGASAATHWDSPPGTPNAAAPMDGEPHGTYVAGIAAGVRTSPSPFRGTASAASVYAVQVLSRSTTGQKATVFESDMLTALQLAVSSLAPLSNGQAQPFTINMSLGGGEYGRGCAGTHPAIATAVQQLLNAGVPVIASTGNEGMKEAIGFPACIPGVIKVSSVANDGFGNTLGEFSNVVDPAMFPGEAFWLAAGGGHGTVVVSASVGGSYMVGSGTSAAAPHIAGAYATAKAAAPSFAVRDVTAWFQANAAIRVPINVTVDGVSRQVDWRRIRLPAL
jgi:hypothetical protein